MADKTEYTFTREEADKFIRTRPDGITFFVRLGAFLPVGDGSTGFEGSGNITVNRKQAREAVASILSKTLQERGARISVAFYPSEGIGKHKGCVFIG